MRTRRIEVLLCALALSACQHESESGSETAVDGSTGAMDESGDDEGPIGPQGDTGPGGDSGPVDDSGPANESGSADDGPADDGTDTSDPCEPDGATASSASACCSGELDDFDRCCSGTACCNGSNHSHATPDGYCDCDDGYEWANDDPYDLTCVQPSTHAVDCTSEGVVDAMWCECTPQDDNTGTVEIDGGCHPDPSFAPMQCCADADYPASGSCACYLTQSWECMAFFDSCSCSYYWDAGAWEYHTTVCDNVPEPDGTLWHCCASPYGSCECEANGGACEVGEVEVADCTNDIALGFTPFLGCGPGQSEVTNCEGGGAGGGECNDTYDCPGDCYGDDPICCPTCDNGNCSVYCCTSDGVCY